MVIELSLKFLSLSVSFDGKDGMIAQPKKTLGWKEPLKTQVSNPTETAFCIVLLSLMSVRLICFITSTSNLFLFLAEIVFHWKAQDISLVTLLWQESTLKLCLPC